MKMTVALSSLIETVRQAAGDGRALRIRGGGSKDFYGGTPVGDILDTRDLQGILSYEPSELVVTVAAGTPLISLEALLAQNGQCLAFEPPRHGSDRRHTTVGGMVAAGLAGPARAVVGGVRDYVLGATLLNGKGELLSFGGQVMKNVAGYDVSRLLAGSMGTLGVICEVSLKVLPIAPMTLTLRFDLDQSTALRRLNEWAGQPLPLSASAWWDDVLVLRLRGAEAAVQAAHRRLGGEIIPEEFAHGFWEGLRDQRDEFFHNAERAIESGAALWRLSVAPTAPRLNLAGEQLIEWGGAQRWVVTTALPAVLQEAAAAARGHATLFRGGPRGDASVAAPLSAPLLRLHRQVKAAFDPHHLFNRQRLHPAL
ncbi:FAD-binding protein [Vitreoscilla filiformis]|jgi:FAD/FMN-containing dehydrogenase|uniref:FAD-binding protein n=1 Tax=Vitreoscilla filiformis TaxID=63 RepID=A0A221KDT1_VITFI|nr:glycolate oxidase subunit GlcE [Vitreoscilla filiformis]ASM77171.1 FAD-binding protein [Vitreoscilla filiformis]